MKFGDNFFADPEIDSVGTSLRGYVKTTREKLTETFGDPIIYPLGDKVTMEWIIQFDSGDVATIYDWKRYDLEYPAFDELFEWNIGGNSYEVKDLVTEALHRSDSSVIN